MMRDTTEGYGVVSRFLHWMMAAAIFAMFGFGLWMDGLDYYHPWYHAAPDLHKSVGIVILLALLFRIGWRFTNSRPVDLSVSKIERFAARAAHIGLYVLLLLLITSGYLMSTADGRSVDVFGLVSIPSLMTDKSLEGIAGFAHWLLAWIVIVLAIVHAAAAVKHHLIDRSHVLTRMWSGPVKSETSTQSS